MRRRAFIDYNLTIAGKQKPKKNQTQFVGDPHDGAASTWALSNIIRGNPKRSRRRGTRIWATFT